MREVKAAPVAMAKLARNDLRCCIVFLICPIGSSVGFVCCNAPVYDGCSGMRISLCEPKSQTLYSDRHVGGRHCTQWLRFECHRSFLV